MKTASAPAAAVDPPRRSSFRSSGLFRGSSVKRRSSASELACDPGTLEKTSLFCPLPKKNIFYSSAYKEHKKKREDKKSVQDDEGSSVDADIPLKRDLTRRMRNSFSRTRSERGMEPSNVHAYLAARVEADKPVVADVYNHSAALLVGLSKGHMLDISIVGIDGIPVRASQFILACYSPVMEDLFFKGHESEMYCRSEQKISVDFCDSEVIKAAVHHCFSGELPSDFNLDSPDENVARRLARLDHLARIFNMKAISEQVYKTERKLINRRPVLACAIFDELSSCDSMGPASIKSYALETMREMPMESLLGGGVQWLKEASIESIMQDQDLDVDEFYMFKILKVWEMGATRVAGDRLAIATRLGKHLELKFINTDLLTTHVKDSGFFTEEAIMETVKLVSESMANQEHEMERVLVEGAGTAAVNGIYVRVEEDLGMSEEEFLFVKEADDGYSDMGLYLWGTKWQIALCADYSNCFYTCDDDPEKPKGELVPQKGWYCSYNGDQPPPCCTYLPHTRATRKEDEDGTILAPNLEEMIDPTIAEKRRSGYFEKRTYDTVDKRVMTLEQMMHLPEDRGDGVNNEKI